VRHRTFGPFVLLGAIAFFLFSIQATARFGLSRLFTRYSLIANSVSAADEAVKISPSDAEAHRARATVLNRLQMPAEAARSLETASSLRYRDDYLWIELGNTREELGDAEGALSALDQAIRWAPYYAHTHWQRGNLLLRMGKTSDAFADLRSAASINESYAPNLIDLAWGISAGNVKIAETLLDIDNADNRDIDAKRLAFIHFLASKGRGKETIAEIHSLHTQLSVDTQNKLVRLLFAAKSFPEAATLSGVSEASLTNGGFEEPFVFNDSAFGWINAPEQKVRFAIDVSEKLSGAKSLQINLNGTWSQGTTLLSQTIIVKPGGSYRLSFSVRTKDLVTGGPPVLMVVDATNNQVLAKSENFPTGTTGWSKLHLEFTALPTSQAAIIRLQRSNCDSSPCPIFGTLWLDEFYIEQTQATTNH
jgi:tetratricopeptide (TPR) repeat protein